jgi:hypothetical protein
VLQKRHGVVLSAVIARKKIHLLFKGSPAPGAVSNDLCRLNKDELDVLLDILGRDSCGDVRIFGHKIESGKKIYMLPGSGFFNLDRIRMIASYAACSKKSAERIARCATILKQYYSR